MIYTYMCTPINACPLTVIDVSTSVYTDRLLMPVQSASRDIGIDKRIH